MIMSKACAGTASVIPVIPGDRAHPDPWWRRCENRLTALQTPLHGGVVLKSSPASESKHRAGRPRKDPPGLRIHFVKQQHGGANPAVVVSPPDQNRSSSSWFRCCSGDGKSCELLARRGQSRLDRVEQLLNDLRGLLLGGSGGRCPQSSISRSSTQSARLISNTYSLH